MTRQAAALALPRVWPALVLGLVLAAGALLAAAPGTARSASVAGQRHPCADWTLSRCDGFLSVPLDRDDPARGSIEIAFTLLPRHDVSRPAEGTVVVAEGGPGVASLRDPGALAPANRTRDLLFFDYRGVGASHHLPCDGLDVNVLDPPPEAIRACAERTGPDAVLFTTAHAADDLAALGDALGVGRFDLVGPSYGNLFAQVFALRHPDRVRTLTLQGVMALEDADPWDRDSARWPVEALRRTCQGSSRCDGHAGADWVTLVERVRHDPGEVSIDELAWLQANFPDRGLGRELAPAARAYLAGDETPLRRLADLRPSRVAPDEAAEIEAREAEILRREGIDPRTWTSPALNLAVLCHDLPLPFDRTAPVEVRREQFAAGRRALPPDSYFPFTPQEWPPELSLLRTPQCVEWSVTAPAQPPVPPGTPYPDVPTLVLNGETDSRTTPIAAAAVAARFPDSALVVVPFADHAPVEEARCAADLVVEFIDTAETGGVRLGDCTGTQDRTLGGFPRRLRDVAPGADARERIATAAVATVADAVARLNQPPGEARPGLRGGRITTSDRDPAALVTLDEARFVEDLAVTGTVGGEPDGEELTATVDVRADDGTTGTLTIAWDRTQPEPIATAAGTIGGRPVRLEAPAT